MKNKTKHITKMRLRIAQPNDSCEVLPCSLCHDLLFAIWVNRALFIAACLSTLAFPFPTRTAAQTVTQVSVGVDHSIFVESDGSLWGMGDNSMGQLGLGASYSGTSLPQQILSSGVGAIASGGYHCLFVETNGSLWGMGDDLDGELGDYTFDVQYVPEQLFLTTNQIRVTGIAAGIHHSMVTTLTPGSRFVLPVYGLWVTGANDFGQLGDGTHNTTDYFQEIQSTVLLFDFVVSMAGGYQHSLIVENNGSLWGTGYNEDGELGVGSPTNNPDTYWESVSGNVVTVAAGYYHSLFIKSDGSLWAMGDNSAGELGNGSNVDAYSPVPVANNVTAIAAGNDFSLFIKSDGSLWGMGANGVGQLGDGTGADQNLPVLIVASNIVAVAAGADHSFFIKSDGTLWAMGDNYDGDLGDGTGFNRLSPVQVVPLVIPQPVITSTSLATSLPYTNLVLGGTNAESGRYYITLASTNLTQPISQWMPVATNFSYTDGAFIFTNAINPNATQTFYILQALAASY